MVNAVKIGENIAKLHTMKSMSLGWISLGQDAILSLDDALPWSESVDSLSDNTKVVFEVPFKKFKPLLSLGVQLFFSSNCTDLNEALAESSKSSEANYDMVFHPESKISNFTESEARFDSFQWIDDLLGPDRARWLPLIVCSYDGGAFNSTTSVQKLVSDDKRPFAANYAQSHFIFSHQFGKRFVIERYIVMSENSSQIGGYPMGSGVIFVGDTLASLEETEEFHNFSLDSYNAWTAKRSLNPLPLQPNEPVAYFEFGSSVVVTGGVSQRKSGRYIKLVPVGFKSTPKNSFPKERFDSYPVEFSFFGVIGDEVESRADLADYSCISFTDGFQNCFDTGCSLKVELWVSNQQDDSSEEWKEQDAAKWQQYFSTIFDGQPWIKVDEVQNLRSSQRLPSSLLHSISESFQAKTITGIG